MENPSALNSIKEIALVVENGISLRNGVIHCAVEVRTFILKEIIRAVGIISAKTTFNSDDEIGICIDGILNDNPQIKLEEIRTVFDNIIKGKYGKFYERFKVAEVMEGFRLYQAEERALALEQRNTFTKKKSIEEQESIERSLKTYVHKKNFGLKERAKKSIAQLKKEILTDAELKELER